jgi:hypothetical protein
MEMMNEPQNRLGLYHFLDSATRAQPVLHATGAARRELLVYRAQVVGGDWCNTNRTAA